MGPVSPQMMIMRIALAKVQALPSTIDECLAKIRKASLTLQNNSRDSSWCLRFSFCVSIDIIFWSARRGSEAALICAAQGLRSRTFGACDRLSLTTQSETE